MILQISQKKIFTPIFFLQFQQVRSRLPREHISLFILGDNSSIELQVRASFAMNFNSFLLTVNNLAFCTYSEVIDVYCKLFREEQRQALLCAVDKSSWRVVVVPKMGLATCNDFPRFV